MKIKSKLIKRIALWKAIWLVFWWIAFLAIPYILNDTDIFLRLWVWLWYITLWAIIWVMWIVNEHPFFKFKFPFYIRWPILGWWMNFILVLIWYNSLTILIQWTIFEWYSPFCLIIEWMIFWLLVDYLSTKFIWEWKKLID